MLTLFFPPPWDPFTVYPSVPVLLQDVKRRGIEAVGVDLNLHLMNRLLTPSHLRAAYQRVINADLGKYPKKAQLHFSQLVPEAERAISNIESAKERLRKKQYDLSSPPKNDWQTLAAATQLISAPFYPCEWYRNTYWIHGLRRRRPETLEEVFEHLRTPGQDFFAWAYTRPEISPLILRDRARVVGISVCTLTQLIPALTLCDFIRSNHKGVHIVLGGPFLRYIIEPLLHAPDIFDYFDSVVLGQGEEILAELYWSIVSGSDWRNQPGIMYRSDGRVKTEPRTRTYQFDQYAPPDYASMNVREYLCDEYEASYISSSGCYWGKCAFCSETHAAGAFPHLSKSAGTVGQELQHILRNTGVKVVEMVDNAMPLKKALQISDYVIRHNLPLLWTLLARMEDEFGEDELKHLARGGLRFVAWGIESFSPKIIRSMNKGIQVERSIRILEASQKAGLWNHVFIMLGFPGEEKDDLLETLDSLSKYNELIDSVTLSNYHLLRNSPVYDNPDEFGIRICEGAERCLDTSYWYQRTPADVELSYEERYGLFELYLANFHFHTGNFQGFTTPRLCTLLEEHGKNALRDCFTEESLRKTLDIAEMF